MSFMVNDLVNIDGTVVRVTEMTAKSGIFDQEAFPDTRKATTEETAQFYQLLEAIKTDPTTPAASQFINSTLNAVKMRIEKLAGIAPSTRIEIRYK